MVQEGFDKYRADSEFIEAEVKHKFEVVPLVTRIDATTQTEELVLINLLQELKEREELSWAVDTIQEGFEKYSRDKLALGEMETEQLVTEEAVQLHRQTEPED